ncbi:hypothetical protein PVAG01_06310 [Phlyctema vagabunda]|uniref:DUF7707 domain-containing protein n=1 Tax=Phlyctema vagabunda TaxID=108571 RepID=A0ABR4PFR9_9HELO
MPSFKTSVAVAAAAFFLGARSQDPYQIDPNSVVLATRQSWCQSQISACPLLCLQLQGESSTTEANDCTADTLEYECICGNGLSPNASEYSQTLPYFICTEYVQQCIATCGGDSLCQSACVSDHPCGAQNPTRINVTSSSSTTATATGSGSSSSGGVVYNGLGGAAETTAASSSNSDSSSQDSGAQTALNLGKSYGLAVVFAGLFAGFALVI